MSGPIRIFLVAAVVCLSTASSALRADEWYFGVKGGGAIVDDAEVGDPSGTLQAAGARVQFDPGLGVAVAIGKAWRFRDKSADLRLEGEVSYRTAQGDQVTTLGAAFPVGGRVTALAFQANLYFDFPTPTPWTPYAGGGIGVARVQMDDASVSGTTIANDHDTAFAFQAIAGIEYALGSALKLGLEYRFMATEDLTFSGGLTSTYRSHNVFIGVRAGF